MTTDEIALIDMIHNDTNPTEALMIAIETIEAYFREKRPKEKCS